MTYKVFLDINILIDLLDNHRVNHHDAVNLINETEFGNCYAFVTESVLNTTSYLLRKDYPTGKIKEMLLHLLSFVELIPVNSAMYTSGLQSALNDIEDAILYTAAVHAKADYFITTNIKDLKKLEIPGLPVVTARDFLALIK